MMTSPNVTMSDSYVNYYADLNALKIWPAVYLAGKQDACEQLDEGWRLPIDAEGKR
jgi:hypothetical protein